jgi:hypothetical protein
MNVLVICVDGLRYDCVGYQPDRNDLKRHGVESLLESGTIDRLAEQSVCFTRCVTTNSYGGASHASLLTGRYPPHHGVRVPRGIRLADGTTLAGRLRAAGFRTVLYDDAPRFLESLGLAKDFDRTLSRREEALFDCLKEEAAENVFLFCRFLDVCEPYLRCEHEYAPGVNRDFSEMIATLGAEHGLPEAPLEGPGGEWPPWSALLNGPLRSRPIRALFPLYVRGVTKFDRGRLRNFLGRLEDLGFLEGALTAVVSAHGEGRCAQTDKERFGHGGPLYDSVIRVPLMLRHPDLQPGVRDDIASIADVTPTVLGLLGFPAGGRETDGINLLSRKRAAAYCEHWISFEGKNGFPGRSCTGGNGREMGAGSAPEFLLHQTALRTAESKYVRFARKDPQRFLAEDLRAPGDANYVRRLYRFLLGRFEDADGAGYFLGVLERREMDRRKLFDFFLGSHEYKMLSTRAPVCAVFHPLEDPDEDLPQPAAVSGRDKPFFDLMDSVEEPAIRAPAGKAGIL